MVNNDHYASFMIHIGESQVRLSDSVVVMVSDNESGFRMGSEWPIVANDD